jgi:integrase
MSATLPSSLRPLPPEAWPAADRTAWAAALRPGDPFSPGGQAAHWRLTSRALVERGYGTWLAWLDGQGFLDDRPPAARLDRNTVKAFVETLEMCWRSATVSMTVDGLVRALQVMAPEADLAWLRTILGHLRSRRHDRKPKLPRLRPARELYDLGLSLMAKAEDELPASSLWTATLYRDGLMIAFLAARALRVGTFSALELDAHVFREGDVYQLVVPAELTKTAQPLETPLPAALTPHIDRYLAVYRPRLARPHSPAHLWLNRHGGALDRKDILARVTKLTAEAFGKSLNPHLFRDCVATSIAIEDPDHVRSAAVLLGHRTLATTERHYNQAGALEAGRCYQKAIGKRRGPARRANRHPSMRR